MTLQRTFSTMLNEYLTNRLLTEELVKRMWFMENVTTDLNWKGGTTPVPFMGNPATSVYVNGLTPANDIGQADAVRGTISTCPKVAYSLIFNQEDLEEHNGKIPESTFLDVMSDVMGPGMTYFKELLSYQFLGGPAVLTVTDATNAASGVFIVDRIERAYKGQKFTLDDGNSSPVGVYITAIDLNTSAVTCSLSRGGAAADLSAYSVAQSAKFYLPGGQDGVFTSMRSALLSSTNGGAATLHAKTKTDYPFLQCINTSGADITASNILEKLFDFWVGVKRKARGNANQLVMSYKHWGSCMKSQQIEKGAFRVVGQPKESEYGFWNTTIASTSTGQSLEIVAVQEFDDDVITAFDKGSVKILSNGGVKKHKSPDGNEYHVVRNTDGYQYIVDILFRGEAMWKGPSRNGILHSISY